MVSAKEPANVWWIERNDTGEVLGTRDRYSSSGLEFGARVPLMWNEYRTAKAAWLRYCVAQGYILRKVTLPGQPVGYLPGPDFRAMPRVSLVEMSLTRGDFEIPTNEDLGIDTET